MADTVRFHTKHHSKAHHTAATAGYFDSAKDPLAGPGNEFMGDFHLSGCFVAYDTTTQMSLLNYVRQISKVYWLLHLLLQRIAHHGPKAVNGQSQEAIHISQIQIITSVLGRLRHLEVTYQGRRQFTT